MSYIVGNHFRITPYQQHELTCLGISVVHQTWTKTFFFYIPYVHKMHFNHLCSLKHSIPFTNGDKMGQKTEITDAYSFLQVSMKVIAFAIIPLDPRSQDGSRLI